MTQRSSWLSVILRTHHIKIKYIVIYENIPSFSTSYATLFVSFLKTNNIYGYLMTPRCQWDIIQITISLPKLQLELNITHFKIYFNPLTHHIRTRKIPSRKVSLQIISLHPFDNMNILCFCPKIPEFQMCSLYRSYTLPHMCKQYPSCHMPVYILTYLLVS